MFSLNGTLKKSGSVGRWETPGTPFTNINYGGIRQRFIFYTQKNHNFRICLPKKITTFFWHTQKNPLVLVLQPKKIPVFFRYPKKLRRVS